jgi:hypothetical protein
VENLTWLHPLIFSTFIGQIKKARPSPRQARAGKLHEKSAFKKKRLSFGSQLLQKKVVRTAAKSIVCITS